MLPPDRNMPHVGQAADVKKSMSLPALLAVVLKVML
jgi:hypothetical protein